ncbi:YcgL domain-containing protein [Marinihelvus fidelis]|uniref:YcgL domain-containing protein n=1 Tax=Marinihelvus fidelis TaxID=2613842 RepID=A0A5N0T7J9_9GAMM|nr:YcgL domain-containing protein [Marinihelvus fidelis]KAA9129796.1 YcgL domain-containing protein [Marinihelvus fidelis]
MKCTVFKSTRRDYTYLYLRDDLELEDIPEELRQLLGDTAEIMTLELSADRPLAQENVESVIANLETEGYHLQLPPKDDPSGWLDLPSAKETK